MEKDILEMKRLLKLINYRVDNEVFKELIFNQEKINVYIKYLETEEHVHFINNINRFGYSALKSIYVLLNDEEIKTFILFYILFGIFDEIDNKYLYEDIDFLREEYLKKEDILKRYVDCYESDINDNTLSSSRDYSTALRRLAYKKITTGQIDNLGLMAVNRKIFFEGRDKNYCSFSNYIKIAIVFTGADVTASLMKDFIAYIFDDKNKKDYNIRIIKNFIRELQERKINIPELLDSCLYQGFMTKEQYKKFNKALLSINV